MKSIISIFFLFVVVTLNTNAQSDFQVVTNYSHQEQGIALPDIVNFTILKISQHDIVGDVIVNVKELNGGADIVQMKASHIILNSGLNIVPFSKYQTIHYLGTEAQKFKLSEMLYGGTFEFCISILTNQTESPFRSCELVALRSFVEIHLISPQHKDKIETVSPFLQWYSTFDQQIEYRINLSELAPYRNAEEALDNNLHLLDLSIVDRNYLYPFSAPALKFGNTYAWQIIAVDKGEIVGRSETWLFTPVEPQIISAENIECYRQINKDFNTGNYLFMDVVKFTYLNYASEQTLSYRIFDSKTGKELKRVPSISLLTGLNKIDIQIKEIEGIKKGNSYSLEIRNRYNERYKFSFDVKK